MPTMYKLLSQDMTSFNDLKWEIGVKQSIPLEKRKYKLCTDGILHCYDDPRLAMIFNPIHAAIADPRLFEIETSEIVVSDGSKMGTWEQTIIRELPMPTIPKNAAIHFAVLCALQINNDKQFVNWAKDWIAGIDRTATAAAAANAAATNAAYNAATAAAYNATAAAYAATAAYAYAATANAAAVATYTATAVAYAYAAPGKKINLKLLLESAIEAER